jgi:hypothetical protein
MPEHIDTHDHRLWHNNLLTVRNRILKTLKDNNIDVVKKNVLFNAWDESIHNCPVAIINYDDVIWDSSFMGDLVKTAKKYNIKFTLITNVFYNNTLKNEWYNVVFIKELFGVFYNPNITQIQSQPAKLYTCLMQRTTFPRLKLFAELSRNKLLNNSNVSLRGMQTGEHNLSANGVAESINNNFGGFDDIISQYDFPYSNFREKDNCYEIEEQSKYVIVSETYNDHANMEWISFTEKTFRSLQIPNISLILNKKGAKEVLDSIGIKTHPINYILDRMITYDSQTDFIIGVLTADMFDLEESNSMATHNQQQLEEWNSTLGTDRFYQSIVDLMHA